MCTISRTEVCNFYKQKCRCKWQINCNNVYASIYFIFGYVTKPECRCVVAFRIFSRDSFVEQILLFYLLLHHDAQYFLQYHTSIKAVCLLNKLVFILLVMYASSMQVQSVAFICVSLDLYSEIMPFSFTAAATALHSSHRLKYVLLVEYGNLVVLLYDWYYHSTANLKLFRIKDEYRRVPSQHAKIGCSIVYKCWQLLGACFKYRPLEILRPFWTRGTCAEGYIWGWAEKFTGWLWCNGWIWPNVVCFQHSLLCGPHTSSIHVGALGFPWYKSSHPVPRKSPQIQIWPHVKWILK